MVKDRQLTRINREEARSKRDFDTGLTIKEWCLLAGYSYSKGRAIVASDGFPIFEEKIAWSDWVIWRRRQVGLITAPCSRKSFIRNSASSGKCYKRRHWYDE